MEQSPFKGMKTFFFVYFMILMLALTFIGVMGWLGYEMVDASIKFVLFGLLAGSAVIGGAWWIVHRIQQKWMKVALGAGMTALVMAVFLLLYMMFSFLLVTTTPLPYIKLGSPSGQNVVILRRMSNDAAMAAQRMTAAGKDASAGPQVEADTGYVYTAYPEVLRFFYNTRANTEGSLEIGYASAAELDYEWTDENTLHMSINNPQPGDGGEFILRLN